MAPLTKTRKLMLIIAISLCFFLAEIAVGFYTHSLALVADAFHYLNDLVGFVVALVAYKVAERDNSPPELSFGWQRATLLGAFFNGVFLLALGVSIFLQAIERFVSIQRVENPRLVLIIGCVGFALNVVSATILHEHDEDVKRVTSISQGSAMDSLSAAEVVRPHQAHRHEALGRDKATKPEHDLGLAGVLIHVMGDAANNVGVIIAASVIWKTHSPARYYADPAVSVAIAFMIFLSSIPLVRKTGLILLESVPSGLQLTDVKHDIEEVPGVLAVHELHVWRLNQRKTLASAHIVVAKSALNNFMGLAQTVNECLHAYGIHSSTLQPETNESILDLPNEETTELGKGPAAAQTCVLGCRATQCENPTCCD
ncbi:hypothetical protein LTR35_017962 [Friedmanniomyces endolithicus]|nr:hypothetical protein LTR35_017962 [Friedmanniomyces endolithicus]KAK0267298.1 hypothetical protein LTS00_017827 [Friedmanniomyces endolithicus]KAK0970084.1 hypothetical protein LTR54_018017 [Friedmanniomyces endolithicus]